MEEKQSKKPEDSNFKQQRLPAWQPLLTPNWVIGTFVVIAAIFLPIGIVIVNESDNVVEVRVRYDDKCSGITNCTVTVNIDETMESPVYMYYELTNYYQNHRRYVKSRSDAQLRGDSGGIADCAPLEENGGDTLYPCGLVANSFFIDNFENNGDKPQLCRNANCTDLIMTKKGISWKSDREHKFKKMDDLTGYSLTSPLLEGYTFPDDIVEDEDFIVWMRTAGLPTFKKLHRKIEDQTLKAGSTIQFSVYNVYPVSEFDGEKAIVLSTTSWLGGKNSFLGWAYIIVAILCLVLAIGFTVKAKISPRPLGDMAYFQWAGTSSSNNE